MLKIPSDSEKESRKNNKQDFILRSSSFQPFAVSIPKYIVREGREIPMAFIRL